MGTGEFNAGGNPAMDWHPIQGGVEIFLVASCHGNRDKLRPGGPLGSYADFTFFLHHNLDPDPTLLLAVVPIRIAYLHDQKEFPKPIAVTPVFSVNGL